MIVNQLVLPLLLGYERGQAMVEVVGAISGEHLVQIRLQSAFALSQLLGPALFSGYPEFGGDLVGVNQRL
ncbi:hypothetical protein AC629_29990 [Bradyrhizobium sp. NAS80.1]|nr:hypothetical protein AC629_29990 [Bradyrhizobium sp. NAS80.1]